MSLETPDKIRNLQRKLYCKAKADPNAGEQHPMIYAYPKDPSVVQGQSLVLCVKASSPYFRVDIFTAGQPMPISNDPEADPFQGQHVILKSSLGWTKNNDWSPDEGFMAPLPFEPADADWAWPEYSYAIPADWPSGLYVAILWEGDDIVPEPQVVQGGEYDRDYKVQDPSSDSPLLLNKPLDQVIPRIESAADPTTLNLAGHSGRAIFVIKSRHPGRNAKILYKLCLFTHHAYNSTGDPPRSFYEVYNGKDGALTRDWDYETVTGDPTSIAVSLRRPGGGTGGFSTVGQDQYMGADSAICYWLQNQEYSVDFCTDLDIHNDDGSFLGAYDLLISGNHDEYWSKQERDNVETFVTNGGNVAFFGANVAWKQVEIIPCPNAPNTNEIYCMRTVFSYDKAFWHQHGEQFQYVKDPNDPNDGRGAQPPQALWWLNAIFDATLSSENSLTGQSYRNGGGRWYERWESNQLGYYLQIDPKTNPYGWIFKDTGLSQYDSFGAENFLVDSECDGVFINDYDDNEPIPPKVTPVTDDTDTHFSNLPPDGYVLLAASVELRGHGGAWNQFPPRTWGKYPNDNLYYFATMGVFTKGLGTVFACGTTQWGRALLRKDTIVSQIAANVIYRLARF